MAAAIQDAVIRLDDPFYTERPHLDFQFLRAEGLKHLGELSGKIWTDHNTHDPGVTILEALCYALIDLGYRAELPVADLLARAPNASSRVPEFAADDNFFTPLEILGCNPTTVLDYRKLLLEVESVRNAWLAPSKEDDQELYLVTSGTGEQTSSKLDCNKPAETEPIRLNGLYSILIEKEPKAKDKKVLTRVRKILSAHRNLCEDFNDIVILCPFEIGVCAEVEIEKTANPEAVYRALIEAVRSYVAPEIRYYTLKQLLDKGKPIEEVFGGRAFRVQSVGFVDTEELNSLSPRKELYASDLYQAILQVEGVTGIRHLSFQTDTAAASEGGKIERLRIPDRYAPAFSLERTCIQVRAGQTVLHIDKERIHKGLARGSKSKLGRESLDIPIPQGRFDPELSNYHSVQHDFPMVYGIGKNGLSKEATPLRKVQALQLQGYLLFYDQVLADYLAQMANIRSLFSLRLESKRSLSERRTYFSQALKEVPGMEQLLQVNIARDLTDGSVLAVPVANDAPLAQKLRELTANPRERLSIEDSCGVPEGALLHYANATVALREVSIRQSIRNLGQGDYCIEIYEDRGGHFFIIRFTEPCESLLVGNPRYRNAAAAREAANFAAFLATRPDYYRKASQKNREDSVDYRYDIVSDSAADAAYLQFLLESESLYLERREAFLDHLLARFAAQFTDYSLVRFTAAETEKQKRELTVEDKSRFLSYFDDSSRNRGRAYNYLKRSWGTHNVSGYEMRICLMAGMTDWARRRLCKLEVVPSYRIEMEDPDGGRWISAQAYHFEEEFRQAREQLKAKLRKGESYDKLERELSGFKANLVRRIFSEIPAEENIEVSGHVYALQLKDSAGNVRQQSEQQDYATEALAWKGLPRFLDEIKGTGESGLELTETGKGSRIYLDKRQLECRIEAVASYRWYQLDENGKQIAKAENTFPEMEAAVADFAQNGDWSRFITQEDGFHWQLTDAEGRLLMTSSAGYEDAAAAIKGFLEAVEAARLNKNYYLVGTGDQPDYRIELRMPDGRVLGATPTLYSADDKVRNSTLKDLRVAIKRLHPPLKLKAEPRQYRWCLHSVSGAKFEDIYSETFARKEDAARDFEVFIRRQVEEEPQSFIGQQVYTIELLPIPARYRFVYCVNSPEGKAWPLLRSAQEFESRQEAAKAYTGFVGALPGLQRTEDTITDGDQVVAKLTDDTEANRQKADQLLEYMRMQYPATGNKYAYAPKCIYRLLDKDHPIARAKNSYTTKDAAQRDVTSVCAFEPYRVDCGKEIIRIVCPALDPERFHYAICLSDDDGKELSDDDRKEFTFLISYLGYETREAARKAAEANWVGLIELATDRDQYGKQIALKETYLAGSGACPEAEPYQAVLADEFRKQLGDGAVDKAVQLAKRYPIRIEYRNGKKGKSARTVKRYKFQGYDLASDEYVWRSRRLYTSPQEALDAYRIFVAVLGNRGGCHDSCRVVCEGGRYWIHLVEILAESGEFATEDDAWGEVPRISKDAYGKVVCTSGGVRLFADIAIAEAAFIPQQKDGCYQFIVVGSDYHVAKHTCSYNTPEKREAALEQVQRETASRSFGPYRLTIETGSLRYYIGEDYYLETSAWQESEIRRIVDRWLYLALGKANYSPVGNRWELLDPFQGGTKPGASIARLGKEGGDFSIERFQQLAREYPVFKKGDSYCFRLYFPGNDKVLDEKLELCACKEPKGSEKEEGPICGKPYIFESVQCYPCREAAENAFGHFRDLLPDKAAYHRDSKSGIGPYSFSIIDPEKVLARYPHCHPDMAGAMRAAERARACLKDEGMHLLEHILLRPQVHDRNAACECLLPVSPDLDCKFTWEDDLDEDDPCASTKNPPVDYIPGADPYSFWVTVVLPSWSQRFQSKETRQFFKEMLYREVPAMVGLNILWLSPKQMCEFDEAFRTWLAWRRGRSHLCEDRDKVLCDLVKCLKSLRNDVLCPTAETVSAECDCLPKVDEQPPACIERADQLFWWTGHENRKAIDEKSQPGSAHAAETHEPVSIDPAAVRQTLAKRKETYRKNLEALTDEKAKNSEGYKQATFFVTHAQEDLSRFEKLTAQILEKDMESAGTETVAAFASVLQNATWYWLDKQVQANPKEVPANVRSFLTGLLHTMKSKGMDISGMAKDWQSEDLRRVMHAGSIEEYVRLLKEA